MENIKNEILFVLSKNKNGLKKSELLDYVDYKLKIALTDNEFKKIILELLKNKSVNFKSSKYLKV